FRGISYRPKAFVSCNVGSRFSATVNCSAGGRSLMSGSVANYSSPTPGTPVDAFNRRHHHSGEVIVLTVRGRELHLAPGTGVCVGPANRPSGRTVLSLSPVQGSADLV